MAEHAPYEIGSTGLFVNLTKSISTEKSDMEAKADIPSVSAVKEEMSKISDPPRETPCEETNGGIEVITNLFFGACGAINRSSASSYNQVLVENSKADNDVYVLDETSGVMADEKKTADDDSGAVKKPAPERERCATPQRKKLGSSFGTPDRAAGGPISAAHRSPSRLSSFVAEGQMSPRKPLLPPKPLGATNELHRIAKLGDWVKLRDCLTTVVNHSKTVSAAGQVDEKGRTPLMLACTHGPHFPADVARLLLVANHTSACVYILQKNSGKQTCLHVATSYGCNIEVLNILHGAYPKAASTQDGNGNMPLHLAVNNGRYRSTGEEKGEEMASSIITDCNHVDPSPVDVSFEGESDSKHSFSTGLEGDSESVGGTSIATPSIATPFFQQGVFQGGNVDDMVNVCEVLISANPSALTHRNRRGETPLLLAIYRRTPSDVLSLLLVRGGAASLEITDDFGSYPIHFCDRSPSLSLVRDMGESYPDAITKKNKMGNTPLYSAMASSCDISVLRTMLECCTKPRETVESKNGDNINILRFGWDDLTTQKVVAAEDQDDEDARLEDCQNLIHNALSPSDISGKYLGDWWAKAELLLQAAYHNTIKADGDSRYGGRLWRPVHAVAGTACPTEMVQFVLRIYAEEAGDIDENHNTPLHIAASRPDIIGIETIQLMLDAHPSSALMQNKDGYSPLHVACLYNAPLEIIELLLTSSPEATSLRNTRGQTALFIALSVGRTVDVLRALLEANPASVHIRDEDGMSVIALAWHMLLSGKVFEERGMDKKSEATRSNANISSLAVISRSYSLKGDIRAWMSKIDLLLRAAFHGTVAESLPKGRQWRAVHAACSGGTVHPDVLSFALQILPGEADVANEGKDYPLHIAASAPPHAANCPPQLGSGEVIELLLKVSTTAVKKTDRRGRLPIHLALKSGKTWRNGVQSLVDCFPESLRMRDPVSMLYPFMLAACSSSRAWCGEETATRCAGGGSLLSEAETAESDPVDLAMCNTIFMLLREAPEMISLPKSNAEIAFLRRSRRELLYEKEQMKEKLSAMEGDLQKRMTPSELKDIEDKKKRELSRQQEEKRRQRAKHLELETRQMTKTMSHLATSMMSLKDEGL